MDWIAGQSRLRILFASMVVLGAALANEAEAQQQPTPPEHYTLDPRGVDLITGSFNHVAVDVVIGPPDGGGIVHGRAYVDGGWRDLLSGTIQVTGSTYIVSLGAESEAFILSGSTFTPVSNTGATLSQSGTILTFTTSRGSVATYSTAYVGYNTPYTANGALLMSQRTPAGEQTAYTWAATDYCKVFNWATRTCIEEGYATRLSSVSNNRGYQVNFTYAADAIVVPRLPYEDWLRRTGAVGINLTVDYCSPYADSCTGLTQTWPSVTYVSTEPYGGKIDSVTDQSGRETTYTYTGNYLTGIRLPDETSDSVTVAYTAGRVSSLTDATGAWTYGYADAAGVRTTTATGPLGLQTVVVSNTTTGRATSVANALGDTVSYLYDGQRRVTRITQPEGQGTTPASNYVQLAYDTRGNVTTTTVVPKLGSGLANIVTSAAYPASCANPVTCNQPTTTTDARGGVTDYTYDATHGGVLTVTAPAPTSGGVRPQTRVTYADRYAWFKNSAGTIVQAATDITLPIQVSTCSSGSTPSPTCVGTDDETRQTLVYGSTGVANNLLPTQATVASGDGSPSATTAMTYTSDGDVASVDGPLSGTTDTTTYRYDDARQVVGVIGPDPDGAGAVLRRAVRNTYDPAGRPTLSEQGTVTGLTDPNWAAFVPLQSVAATYDAMGHPTHQRLQAGSTTYGLQQVSYDAAGRPACSTVRMNLSIAAPISACTAATAGAFGPDRITEYVYDDAGRIEYVTTAAGTGAEAVTRTLYTDNGQVELVQSAVNGVVQRSTWEYDGFDRVHKLRYPLPAGGSSSTTDYEEYGYDAGSNVISFRDRAATLFHFAYDALGRRTFMNVPGGASFDTTWVYDNLGRSLEVSTATHPLSFTWDALGRLTSQTSPRGTMTAQFDAAGRRTRLTWPDGFYAAYDFDPYDAVTEIRANSATPGTSVLGQYSYDNLGRRTRVDRVGGYDTAYEYDPASRLSELAHNLSGTAFDTRMEYDYNLASQIVGREAANDAYAWTGGVDDTIPYVNNQLNQATSADGVAITYDLRGRIASDGAQTYTYDNLNRIRAVDGIGTYVTDPLSRMYQEAVVGLPAVQFLYDGLQIVAEYATSGGAMLKRYVPGPGVDELAGWYDAAGVQYRPITDERGSVIGNLTPAGGLLNGPLSYDEYGNPGVGNSERFQYTGQMRLRGTDLYYYKARVYDPSLGRFLQPDPIGYAAGMNLYAYVEGDPVNYTDSSGTCPMCVAFAAGFLVSGGIELYKQSQSPEGLTWGGAGLAVVQGGIGGSSALVGGGLGLALGKAISPIVAQGIGGAVGGGVGGFVGNGVSARAAGNSYDSVLDEALTGGLWGSVLGGAGAGARQYLKPSGLRRGVDSFRPIVQWQPSGSGSASGGAILGEGVASLWGAGYDLSGVLTNPSPSRIQPCWIRVEGRWLQCTFQ